MLICYILSRAWVSVSLENEVQTVMYILGLTGHSQPNCNPHQPDLSTTPPPPLHNNALSRTKISFLHYCNVSDWKPLSSVFSVLQHTLTQMYFMSYLFNGIKLLVMNMSLSVKNQFANVPICTHSQLHFVLNTSFTLGWIQMRSNTCSVIFACKIPAKVWTCVSSFNSNLGKNYHQ